MSELKQRALALYKPPFRRVGGYIYDADSRVVADDAAAYDEEAVLRIRGWGRIQYLVDPEALQDAAGDLIAEAMTEYWQRRTQPEAAAPAQDLSAAILAIKLPEPFFAGGEDAGFYFPPSFSEDQMRKLLKAAAALASSANALSAGDRMDAERYRWLRNASYLPFDFDMAKRGLELDQQVDAILQSQGGNACES